MPSEPTPAGFPGLMERVNAHVFALEEENRQLRSQLAHSDDAINDMCDRLNDVERERDDALAKLAEAEAALSSPTY